LKTSVDVDYMKVVMKTWCTKETSRTQSTKDDKAIDVWRVPKDDPFIVYDQLETLHLDANLINYNELTKMQKKLVLEVQIF